MPTISEFVAGESLERAIVSNSAAYRKAFNKIITKTGISDLDVGDKSAHARITKTITWSWFGFFCSSYWAIYRNLKIGWIGLGITLILGYPALWQSYPLIDKVGDYFILALGLVLGMSGKSLVFLSVLKKHNKAGTVEIEPQRSPVGLAIAIAILIGHIGVLVVSQ